MKAVHAVRGAAVRVDVLVERNGLLIERLDRGELDLVPAMNRDGCARRASGHASDDLDFP